MLYNETYLIKTLRYIMYVQDIIRFILVGTYR